MGETNWSIVFSEYNLPQFTGQEALNVIRRFDTYVPFILVSGPIGEQKTVEIMRSGASDYLMKDSLTRLPVAIRRVINEAGHEKRHDNTARLGQEHIAQGLTQLIDTANAPIFGIDAGGRVNEWNLSAAAITGYSKKEVLGRDLVEDFITEDYKEAVSEVLAAGLAGRRDVELRIATIDEKSTACHGIA